MRVVGCLSVAFGLAMFFGPMLVVTLAIASMAPGGVPGVGGLALRDILDLLVISAVMFGLVAHLFPIAGGIACLGAFAFTVGLVIVGRAGRSEAPLSPRLEPTFGNRRSIRVPGAAVASDRGDGRIGDGPRGVIFDDPGLVRA